MAKCKICGNPVRAGMVMHLSCMEELEKELQAKEEALCLKSEKLAEREQELDLRELEQEIHEGFLDDYYKEILDESKRAKRMLNWNLAVAAFTITLSLIIIIV